MMHHRHSKLTRGIVDGAGYVIAAIACVILAIAYVLTWIIDIAWLTLRGSGYMMAGHVGPFDDLVTYVREVIIKDVREVWWLIF